MKTVCLYVLLGFVLVICSCTTGESFFRAGYDFSRVQKVAVVEVVGDISGEAAKNQISDFFVMEFLKKGYAPVERSQVLSLLEEQEFQAGDLTTAEGAARVGRILNVPVVLVVNIPNFGEDISMTAKMIDVEDGSILWMGSGTGSTGKTLATIAGVAVGVGAGAAAVGEDDKVLAGVTGGVLGGVAGRALSPQKAAKAKEIIKRICRSLPSRL